MKITRRHFVGLLAAAASGGGYAFLVEPSWLRLKSYVLYSPKWPKDAKPLRIAFASDIHAGCPSVGPEEIAAIVTRLNALKADIIFLGGDFLIQGVLFGDIMPPEEIASLLAPLDAPLGVYSVLGNHDWMGDGPGMWRALEGIGITVLENASVRVEKDGHVFHVAGIADDTKRTPDYAKTLRAAQDDDLPVLLLAHDPASFLDVDDRPVITLCGHTHGGQVTIPYISPIVIPGRAPLKYAYGHIQEGGRDMIVTGGIGTSILPVRFGRRPEIVLIEISSRTGGNA